MSHHFGKEKLHMAMLDLVAPGDIHTRVTAAVCQHLLHVKENEDLPDSARSAFARLRQALRLDGPESHQITDTINNLSETDAERIAQKIVALHEAVIQEGV
jgi:DNA-directed RNA polymerase subunit F